VATASIRDEGTSAQYLPPEFPAVAHIDVVNALREGIKSLGLPYHCGIVQSKDSFYGEVERTRMPMAAALEERWNAFIAGGALSSEMESSILFVLASIYRKRAGGVLLVINDSELGEISQSDKDKHMTEFNTDNLIKAAVEGLKKLIQEDRR
jgi:uridine phosphorylase